MAMDEALLSRINAPVLRVYRWVQPAVSFGYFEKWEPVRTAYPQRDLVRRWTGGGVGPHGVGEDWTYSVLVPATCRFADVDLAESYRIIHEAVVLTLIRC